MVLFLILKKAKMVSNLDETICLSSFFFFFSLFFYLDLTGSLLLFSSCNHDYENSGTTVKCK